MKHLKTFENISQEDVYLISDALNITLQDLSIEEIPFDRGEPAETMIRHFHKTNKIYPITFCVKPEVDSMKIFIVLNKIMKETLEPGLRSFYRRIVKFGWAKLGSVWVESIRANRLPVGIATDYELTTLTITIQKLELKIKKIK